MLAYATAVAHVLNCLFGRVSEARSDRKKDRKRSATVAAGP